ncbi:MAG TPA: BlaI/MecI/CopY family transcriptional regulator [Polyangiaceae bacterium]|nr:BlaI/MecI/CopY family transcriptional regulator [Polyangiaceae bacterium]
MPKAKAAAPPALTRREREIMDILYRLGRATAAEVLEQMAEPPSYSAVRALLRLLEERGHVTHAQDGPRYVYAPSEPRESARRSALAHLVRTFFGGSVEQAVVALVESSGGDLSDEERRRLESLVRGAKREGR